jgi:hypothetical protein
VPSRRLDDRIRDLCALIVSTPKDAHESVVKDLQTAIHQKVETLRMIAAKRFFGAPTSKTADQAQMKQMASARPLDPSNLASFRPRHPA